MPELGHSTHHVIRSTYGFLLTLTLISLLPNAQYFFTSEKWKGYIQTSAPGNWLHHKRLIPFLMVVWFACSLCLLLNTYSMFAAILNLILCYHFFIQLRWKSLLRGMGAPGFLCWWLGVAVTLLELTFHFSPRLRPLVTLVLQVDFACIMLAAGVSKFTDGYRTHNGMEWGMANPMWGYWPNFFQKMRPAHPLFSIFNFLAWSIEIVAALLMLYPPTRLIGGILIAVSFLFLIPQIRLGWLAEMMVLACFIFIPKDSQIERWFSQLDFAPSFPLSPGWPHSFDSILGALLLGYLILRPLLQIGLWVNYYGKYQFPHPIQSTLEFFSNLFGVILWRVFTAMLIDFYVIVLFESRESKEQRTISQWGRWAQWNERAPFRFHSVAEAITVCTIFTTLRYFSSQSDLFEKRLVRYAQSLDCPKNSVVTFQLYELAKKEQSFESQLSLIFSVEPISGSVQREVLPTSHFMNRGGSTARIQGVQPGSYAAATS